MLGDKIEISVVFVVTDFTQSQRETKVCTFQVTLSQTSRFQVTPNQVKSRTRIFTEMIIFYIY